MSHLFLIFCIFIAACIETDIYLPSFPDMMQYFHASAEEIQSLLTWNFFGMCVSGPLYGPISDALGRKKPLLFALLLFFLGSILTVAAPTMGMMLAGRLLQGLGSGGCFTLGTAILFDAFKGESAVRALNKLNSVTPFLLASAPLLGGYLNYSFGFRANFLLIALFVLLSLAITLFFYDETLPPENREAIELKKIAANFWRALTNLALWQTIMIVSLLFAGYLTFLSTISVLYVDSLEVRIEQLPVYQAAILFSWLLGGISLNRMLSLLGKERVKALGTKLVAIGGVSFIVVGFFLPLNAELQTLTMMLYTLGFNWTQSLYFPEGMEIMPEIKGIAASILTSTRLLVTASIVGLSSSCYNGTIYPLVLVLFFVLATCLPTIFLYNRRRLYQP